MDSAIWMAVLVTAAGTYCMRMLPMLWMQRHLDKHNDKEAFDVLPQWLSLLGPLMIAAMFGGALVPRSGDPIYWVATAGGVLVTALVWLRTRSLGIPVFSGVLAYGIAYLALGA